MAKRLQEFNGGKNILKILQEDNMINISKIQLTFRNFSLKSNAFIFIYF